MSLCPHQTKSNSWENDWPGASDPPQVEAPYFDTHRNSWVFSRYADVVAACNSVDLVLVGPTSKNAPVVDEAARLHMRMETRNALSSAELRTWRKHTLDHARACLRVIDWGNPVDLIQAYAEPVCLALAVLITKPETEDLEYLNSLAQSVSEAAAEPFDDQLKVNSKAASAALHPFFHRGPESLRESGYVALSRTMVHLLGNSWFALLRHPEEWRHLHRHPALIARGIEELLRFAGLTRLVYRCAIADTTINGTQIRKGERLILRMVAANRDPERFTDPHTLSVMRRNLSQLSLGTGRHACVGAPLIRMIATVTTYALLEQLSSPKLLEPIEWRGGTGFLSPSRLPVLA